MDSLVYAISDQDGQILVLKQYEIESPSNHLTEIAQTFQAVFEKDELLKFLYRKCHIAFGGNVVALVPQRLFDSKKATVFLGELTTLSKEAVVEYNELVDLKTMVVYQQQTALHKVVKAAQPSSKIFHKTTPFLIGTTKKAAKEAGKVIFANFEKTSFEVAFFENGQLHFYNNFEFQNAADCLYFVLLVFEQFNLNPNEVPLFLSGLILENSEIYKSLYRYIRYLSFTSPTNNIKINSGFKKIPVHTYFSLFSLKLL